MPYEINTKSNLQRQSSVYGGSVSGLSGVSNRAYQSVQGSIGSASRSNFSASETGLASGLNSFGLSVSGFVSSSGAYPSQSAPNRGTIGGGSSSPTNEGETVVFNVVLGDANGFVLGDANGFVLGVPNN